MEKSIINLFNIYYQKAENDPEEPVLYRKLHIEYLKGYLSHLPQFYEVSL